MVKQNIWADTTMWKTNNWIPSLPLCVLQVVQWYSGARPAQVPERGPGCWIPPSWGFLFSSSLLLLAGRCEEPRLQNPSFLFSSREGEEGWRSGKERERKRERGERRKGRGERVWGDKQQVCPTDERGWVWWRLMRRKIYWSILSSCFGPNRGRYSSVLFITLRECYKQRTTHLNIDHWASAYVIMLHSINLVTNVYLPIFCCWLKWKDVHQAKCIFPKHTLAIFYESFIKVMSRF